MTKTLMASEWTSESSENPFHRNTLQNSTDNSIHQIETHQESYQCLSPLQNQATLSASPSIVWFLLFLLIIVLNDPSLVISPHVLSYKYSSSLFFHHHEVLTIKSSFIMTKGLLRCWQINILPFHSVRLF